MSWPCFAHFSRQTWPYLPQTNYQGQVYSAFFSLKFWLTWQFGMKVWSVSFTEILICQFQLKASADSYVHLDRTHLPTSVEYFRSKTIECGQILSPWPIHRPCNHLPNAFVGQLCSLLGPQGLAFCILTTNEQLLIANIQASSQRDKIYPTKWKQRFSSR